MLQDLMENYKNDFGFKKLPISDKLQEFFTEYAQWIEAGYPPDKTFEKEFNICSSLFLWLEWAAETPLEAEKLENEFREVRRELFGENYVFPFSHWENCDGGAIGIHNPARKCFILLYGKNS